MKTPVEADYVVVGAGAMGMAFADTLIAETDATVAIVDRYHRPGGHWNVAYPFVRLHQPSTGYGVNSRHLGSDAIDATGWNAGLYELASGAEVCAYFDQVMQQTLLPSGRVTYLPMCQHLGDGRARSIVSGETFEVNARRRTVDSTYQGVTVPAMRPPTYEVGPEAHCAPLNALVELREAYDHYTIVGAGKTGIDACLWLLRHGVDPDRLTWIRPRDSWLVDRALCQPGPLFADRIGSRFSDQGRAIAQATSVDDLFDRLEASGLILRLDPAVRPMMYRCATVSLAELEQLRRIRDVVRLGHVARIERRVMVLEHGERPVAPRTLHVDCTADGLEKRPAVPVFDGPRITLQSVRTCQQVFSAALIAHVEAAYPDDAARNRLCAPIPHPDTARDWLRTTIDNGRNERLWAEDGALRDWLAGSRLNWLRRVGPSPPTEPSARAAIERHVREASLAVGQKLEVLLAEARPIPAASRGPETDHG
jgi:hypothetical protein